MPNGRWIPPTPRGRLPRSGPLRWSVGTMLLALGATGPLVLMVQRFLAPMLADSEGGAFIVVVGSNAILLLVAAVVVRRLPSAWGVGVLLLLLIATFGPVLFNLKLFGMEERPPGSAQSKQVAAILFFAAFFGSATLGAAVGWLVSWADENSVR